MWSKLPRAVSVVWYRERERAEPGASSSGVGVVASANAGVAAAATPAVAAAALRLEEGGVLVASVLVEVSCSGSMWTVPSLSAKAAARSADSRSTEYMEKPCLASTARAFCTWGVERSIASALSSVTPCCVTSRWLSRRMAFSMRGGHFLSPRMSATLLLVESRAACRKRKQRSARGTAHFSFVGTVSRCLVALSAKYVSPLSSWHLDTLSWYFCTL
mmetsp:Transcript_11161/g.40930  ORF Transcript_11161/g.40930 Transcript_11161/m.40930 type:complete len:217 (+) Transcript_11161:1382-2032(+)